MSENFILSWANSQLLDLNYFHPRSVRHPDRDMVVVATEHLSEKGAMALRSDGWIVKRVAFVDNPGTAQAFQGGFPRRFWGVYSKLNVWNLVEYRKVSNVQAPRVPLSPRPRAPQQFFPASPSCLTFALITTPNPLPIRSSTSTRTRFSAATSTSCSPAPASARSCGTRSGSIRA